MQKLIGIDPGINTGFAIMINGALTELKTLEVHEAITLVKQHPDAHFFVEDARLRKWFGARGSFNHQGVGAVKIISKIFEQAITAQKSRLELIAPKHNTTKLSADYFSRITGWVGRTSEHARDAAMLVFGRK
jgi:hypothetical protein